MEIFKVSLPELPIITSFLYVLNPIYWILRLHFFCVIFLIEKFPSTSVAAPCDVFSIITFAPMRGLLFAESNTFPEIL